MRPAHLPNSNLTSSLNRATKCYQPRVTSTPLGFYPGALRHVNCVSGERLAVRRMESIQGCCPNVNGQCAATPRVAYIVQTPLPSFAERSKCRCHRPIETLLDLLSTDTFEYSFSISEETQLARDTRASASDGLVRDPAPALYPSRSLPVNFDLCPHLANGELSNSIDLYNYIRSAAKRKQGLIKVHTKVRPVSDCECECESLDRRVISRKCDESLPLMIISTDRPPLYQSRRSVSPVFYPSLGDEGISRSIGSYESRSHGHHTSVENRGVPNDISGMNIGKVVEDGRMGGGGRRRYDDGG
jgi:hypothetical protein